MSKFSTNLKAVKYNWYVLMALIGVVIILSPIKPAIATYKGPGGTTSDIIKWLETGSVYDALKNSNVNEGDAEADAVQVSYNNTTSKFISPPPKENPSSEPLANFVNNLFGGKLGIDVTDPAHSEKLNAAVSGFVDALGITGGGQSTQTTNDAEGGFYVQSYGGIQTTDPNSKYDIGSSNFTAVSQSVFFNGGTAGSFYLPIDGPGGKIDASGGIVLDYQPNWIILANRANIVSQISDDINDIPPPSSNIFSSDSQVPNEIIHDYLSDILSSIDDFLNNLPSEEDGGNVFDFEDYYNYQPNSDFIILNPDNPPGSINPSTETYSIKVDIANPGSGKGRVSSSAFSSYDWSFSGWSGGLCSGKDNCVIENFIGSSKNVCVKVDPSIKEVVASFNRQ